MDAVGEEAGEALIRRVRRGAEGPGIAALFDLDRTLIEGYTAAAFLRHRLQTKTMAPRELLRTVSATLAYRAGRIGFAAFLQETTAAGRGLAESVLSELGEAVFMRHLAARLYPEAIRLIEAHRRRGHFLAIVTSATRYQVEPIAHRLGIPFVACNRLETRAGILTGRILHPVCYGRGKLEAARRFEARHGFALAHSYFYSDSHEDLPLLEAVAHPCAINPTPRLAAVAGGARLADPRLPFAGGQTKQALESHGIADVGLWRGGVDTRLFAPQKRCLETRARMVGDGRIDAPLLLYAGRVAPEKGLAHLRPVLDRLPECRLAIVGDGPARPELEALFAETPTRFLGFLRGEALARAFASADVFVMPSMTETLGFVVLEAMSSGLPVVAAPGGGIPDLVLEGETGALVDPTDAEKLAQRIREILCDDARRAEWGARARRFAEECDWPSETRGLVAEYERTRARVRRRSGELD